VPISETGSGRRYNNNNNNNNNIITSCIIYTGRVHRYYFICVHGSLRACVHGCPYVCMCVCVYLCVYTHKNTPKKITPPGDWVLFLRESSGPK